MPKGENLIRVRPPLEVRLKRLGAGELLAPGEATAVMRVRAQAKAIALLQRMTAKERGRVVEAGLEVLGLLEVRDAKTDEQTP